MSVDDNPADGAATAFERRSRELLRASAERLDAHARSRLTQARYAALAALAAGEGSPRFRVPGLWLPAGALAAAAVLAVAVWIGQPGPERAALAEAGAVEDADILASGDGPELYAEEAEFYEWAGGDGPGAAGGSDLADPAGGAAPAGSAASRG
jgi:hypothetical protein